MKRRKLLKTKTVEVGVLLVVISLIAAAVQDLHIYNIYGNVSNKWYFYGTIAVILIIGIILVVWGLTKKSRK